MPLKKERPSIGDVMNERVGESGLKVKSTTNKTQKRKRDDLIRFRFPSEDKAILEAYCERIGSSLSTEIRRLVYAFMDENGLR